MPVPLLLFWPAAVRVVVTGENGGRRRQARIRAAAAGAVRCSLFPDTAALGWEEERDRVGPAGPGPRATDAQQGQTRGQQRRSSSISFAVAGSLPLRSSLPSA